MRFNLSSENINYIKINYADKDGFTHYIKTAVRLINEYEILTSIKSDKKPNIETPKEVFIHIVTDNGVYKAKTLLKKIEIDEPYYLLLINKPADVEFQQNREFFRVRLQENISIFYEKDSQQINLSAITYDLSGNGVSIELEKNIQFPPEVTLTIYLPKRTINVKAKYIRTDNEDDILKASFNFLNLSERDADYIIQVCFNKQLEDRRNR